MTDERRETETFDLPADLLDRLRDFCREHGVDPSTVVERALDEYFREGDESH